MIPAAEAVLAQLRRDVDAAQRDLEEARTAFALDRNASWGAAGWSPTPGYHSREVAVRAAERDLDHARERLAGALQLATTLETP